MRLFAVLLCVSLLLACSNEGDMILFDGHAYQTRAEITDRSDRRRFKITVRNPEVSWIGARAAGEFEAIRYCIGAYGTSELNWFPGSHEEDHDNVDDGRDLVLFGECRPR